MRCKFYPGDCLAVLPTLAENSVDACVTDPPYHLTSIVQRFGAPDAQPPKFKTRPYGGNFKGSDAPGGGTGAAFARMSKGFMGKVWDGGDLSFKPETWKEVYRVLKPGAHLLAFGGTRTFHRLACAIEDAGFEIRDTVLWVYGSGFPKSHDVSKGIDKANGRKFEDRYELGQHIKECREALGITRAALNAKFNSVAICDHWEAQNLNNASVPTPEHWEWLKRRLGCDSRFDVLVDRVEAEREIIGRYDTDMGGLGGQQLGTNGGNITAPTTDAAKQWQGWGTALKPACELIILARKPLSEKTVAANVLKWGTGALNIDACRVTTNPTVDDKRLGGNGDWSGDKLGYHGSANGARHPSSTLGRWPANLIHDDSDEVRSFFPNSDHARGNIGASKGGGGMYGHGPCTNNFGAGDNGSAARFFKSIPGRPLVVSNRRKGNVVYGDGLQGSKQIGTTTQGRWPANLIHDNSDEVRAFFPDSMPSGSAQAGVPTSRKHGKQIVFGDRGIGTPDVYHNDSGSAARFFYSPKASKLDRNGSSHPTVKPIKLLQYLVRLITPQNGTVIDPFAGTGTLATAAHRERAHSIVIESDPAYQQDIRERLRGLFTTTAGVRNVQTRVSLNATGRNRLARERADRDQTIIPWA